LTPYSYQQTLSADSYGLFPSQEETVTPVRANFNDSNHNICESTSDDGLATPRASDFARRRAAKLTASGDVFNGLNQALPLGSAFEIKRRDSKISPTKPSHAQDPLIVGLASDIIPRFPDPPCWVVGSPPRSAFDDDDDDDDETEGVCMSSGPDSF
jgi:hypothetical protein